MKTFEMDNWNVIEAAKQQLQAAKFKPTCLYYFDGKEWVFVELKKDTDLG